MLTTTDSTTLAYINMYAVLGALENLCELVPEAREILADTNPIRIAFVVHNGPAATLYFENGKCIMRDGADPKAEIKLPFKSVEKFNGLLDGTTTPIPSKGFTKISFLLKTFVPLTDLLSKYLQPSDEDMQDPDFKTISTMLTLYVAGVAIAQVGNRDKSGKFSTNLIPDGDIAINIKDSIGITVRVKDHRMVTLKKRSEKPRAIMEFASLDTAGALLRGEASAMACICDGSIAMAGMVNMVDNINRILDRVSLYLS